MKDDDGEIALKKFKRTERRRMKRQKTKQMKTVCFNCRKPGHRLADCPEVLGAQEFAVGVCFKCGSTEHTVAQCRLTIKGFPYAKCFVCGETGHLSRNCEQNPNGAFPQGGNCKICGAIDHMKKDCPLGAPENEEKNAVHCGIMKNDQMRSADEDVVSFCDDQEEEPSAKKKRKTKIVRF